MFSILLSIILLFIQTPSSLFQGNQVVSYPYSLGLVLSAKSALVADKETEKILYEKSKEEILPIASLTKLMTAIVFLENRNIEFEDFIVFKKEDQAEPTRMKVLPGEKIRVKDIFEAALVGSANDAAKILSRLTKEPEKFVELMNLKAKEFDLEKTEFFEPTGLDPKNVSCASDLVLFFEKALEKEEIAEALKKTEISFKVKKADNSFYWRRIKNTNKLLNGSINFLAKTGYLEESGHCFIGLTKNEDQELIVVILNAPSSKQRFEEVKVLFGWVSKAFQK